LIDDINDPAAWEKANPIICSYPEGREYLKNKLLEAQNAPEKMRNFLTKHLNVWVNQRAAGYMNMEKWSHCAVDTPSFTLTSCWIGLDLSAKIDLTSCTFEFTDGESYYVKSHSFMPEESFLARQKADKAPYDLWKLQGYITVTEGATVDYRAVIDYAIKTCDDNGWTIEEFCIDPWGATQISSDLMDRGYTVVDIIQGIKTLSEPTKNFREMVYSGRLNYEPNPVLTWAVGNAVVREDHNKNMMLDKGKAKQRIDPIAATINAHVRAMNNKPTGQSRALFF
jgi:phage terminase large subunit-like protein